jgi:hypothetical protein
MSLIIVGLDPSLRNFGMMKCMLDSSGLHYISHRLIQPEINKGKQVRKNSSDLERARMLYLELRSFLVGVDIVCVEIPVGSQSARSMASYGICIGVLSSIEQPLIQVTPSEVKLATGQTKNASKAEMITWAVNNYPDIPWMTKTQKGVTTYIADNEHLADALAALIAGTKTDTFKLSQQLLRSRP